MILLILIVKIKKIAILINKIKITYLQKRFDVWLKIAGHFN
jgi:hypothetical protein